MTEHYYSSKPTTASARQRMQVTLRGKAFAFETDAGVFSKEAIDFGSRLLIETMELSENDHVLDVGCGYGPIGLSAAAACTRGQVTMIDINERAVQLARANAERNGLANVRIEQVDLMQPWPPGPYSKIVTNPPIRAGKAVVHHIFETAPALLAPDGQLWVVIQKKQGAPSAKAKLETLFREVEEVAKDKGYRIFRASL